MKYALGSATPLKATRPSDQPEIETNWITYPYDYNTHKLGFAKRPGTSKPMMAKVAGTFVRWSCLRSMRRASQTQPLIAYPINPRGVIPSGDNLPSTHRAKAGSWLTIRETRYPETCRPAILQEVGALGIESKVSALIRAWRGRTSTREGPRPRPARHPPCNGTSQPLLHRQYSPQSTELWHQRRGHAVATPRKQPRKQPRDRWERY